jgi:hypothetical protein
MTDDRELGSVASCYRHSRSTDVWRRTRPVGQAYQGFLAAAALNVAPLSISRTSSSRPASPSLHLPSSMSLQPFTKTVGSSASRRGGGNRFGAYSTGVGLSLRATELMQ